MLVRMIWQMSGTRGDGQDWVNPGEVMNLPDHEARSLITYGAAVPMVEERKVETADAPPDPSVEVRGAEPDPREELRVAEEASRHVGGYVPNNPEPEEPVKRGPGRPPGSGKKNGA